MQVPPLSVAALVDSTPRPGVPRISPVAVPPSIPVFHDDVAGKKLGLMIGGGVGALLVVGGLIFAMTRSGGVRPDPPAVPDRVAAADPAPDGPAVVKAAANRADSSDSPPPPPQPFEARPAPSAFAKSSRQPIGGESPAVTIQRVKAATVYIKMKVGTTAGTGTGFVIRTDGDKALIATNRHVAAPHLDGEIPGLKPTDRPDLTVVFRSGEGASQEQSLPGRLVAVDTDPSPNRDLAIVEVRGVRDMPRPIDPARMVEPVEGMELRIYGFPFGAMMNVTARGNPSITINKGSVAALRRDDHGRLSLVQIDGSINPGNSGGPIVDDAGRLIGVSVLKLKAADNIGLAIPAAEVNRLLAGRVGGVDVALRASRPGSIDLDVRATLADPLGRLRAVRARVAPAPPGNDDGTRLTASARGDLPPLPNAQEAVLRIDRGSNTATGTVSLRAGGVPKRVVVQLAYENGESTEVNAAPMAFDVPLRPGPLLAQGVRRGQGDDRARKTLEKLGKLIDPLSDCAMTRDDKALSITIPGKLHILSPQIRDRANKGIKNAPMILAEVNGDFVAHVRVAGDMRPGTEPSLDPRGKKIPFSIQGAGLLLWEDRDNYLRLERSCGTMGTNSLTLSNRLILEVCKEGKEAGHAYVEIPEGPMHVLLVRQKGHLRCLFSPNGEKWVAFKELAVDFPPKINIGLSAFNTAKKEYTARFEDFVLVDDRDKIDQEIKP